MKARRTRLPLRAAGFLLATALSTSAHATALAPALEAHVLATLRAQTTEFERCFVENEPGNPSSVTLAFVIGPRGYAQRAAIVQGRAGLDSPGLCLVDHFHLMPGVRFAAPELRGRRLRATFQFSPSAQPRLTITARE